jgi:4-amino-4-deoxy-L-arabinose transferase-like glycosyltransferase
MAGRGDTLSRAATLAFVFVLALVVRSLCAVDQAPVMYTPEQTGTRMAQRYDDAAVGILSGEGILWPRVRDKQRTGLIARPPGYALYLATVYRTLGRSFFASQLVQNLLMSLCCALLVLVAARLASWPTGVVAGTLAALAPQLGHVSALVLPDALSALPLVVALLILARAHPDRTSPWWVSAAAGGLVGTGVWLRPNVVLLPPFLSLVVLIVARDRRRGLVHAVALSLAAVLVVVPITIRNYVVFGEFVPVSINGGLTLWQGVAEAGGREHGARYQDTLVAQEEAERYGDPRYLDWWAEPDGIWRDNERYRRALAVIRANPGRYARLMLRRMGEMLNYASGEAPLVVVPAPPPPALEAKLERRAEAPRTPRDESAFLAPGRLAAPLRPLVQALQAVLCAVALPLALAGTVLLARRDWRRALLLLSVSVYYLLSESPFLYEWRVVSPMHYGLFASAAAALVTAWQAAARLRDRGRSGPAGAQGITG